MLKFTNLLKPEYRMKVITRLLPLYFPIVLLAAACGRKPPADELEAIKYTGLIRVGISADAPPFESLDERGQMVGFDIDFTDAYFNLKDGVTAVQPANRPTLNNGPLFIVVPKGADQLMKALNNTIADMLADGFIEDLSQKHLLDNP